MTLVAPFDSRHLSDPFGVWQQWRKNMGLGPHRGQDFNGLPEGTPIPASGDGVVTQSHWNSVLGNITVIYYPSARVYLGYCHMKYPGLPVGSKVTRGTTVGLLGNTGSATTGAHLHLTASREDADPGWADVIDPMPFFTAPAGGDATPITTTRRRKNMQGVIYTDEPATDAGNKSRSGAIVNTESGFVSTFGWFPPAYADGIAVGFGLAKAAEVTRGQYNEIVGDVRAFAARG